MEEHSLSTRLRMGGNRTSLAQGGREYIKKRSPIKKASTAFQSREEESDVMTK